MANFKPYKSLVYVLASVATGTALWFNRTHASNVKAVDAAECMGAYVERFTAVNGYIPVINTASSTNYLAITNVHTVVTNMYVGTNLVPTTILVTNVFSTNYADAINGIITNYVPAFPTDSFWRSIENGTEDVYDNNKWDLGTNDVSSFFTMPMLVRDYNVTQTGNVKYVVATTMKEGYSPQAIGTRDETTIEVLPYLGGDPDYYFPWGDGGDWWNYIGAGTNKWHFDATNWYFVTTNRNNRIKNVYDRGPNRTWHSVPYPHLLSFNEFSGEVHTNTALEALEYALTNLTTATSIGRPALTLDMYPVSYSSYTNWNVYISWLSELPTNDVVLTQITVPMRRTQAIKSVQIVRQLDMRFDFIGVPHSARVSGSDITVADCFNDTSTVFGGYTPSYDASTMYGSISFSTNEYYTIYPDPCVFYKTIATLTPSDTPALTNTTLDAITFDFPGLQISTTNAASILAVSRNYVYGDFVDGRYEANYQPFAGGSYYLVIDWDWKYLPPQ